MAVCFANTWFLTSVSRPVYTFASADMHTGQVGRFALL